MKLVIDIPERYYEFCRECLFNRTDTVDQQFIANGTPYEERPKGKWEDGEEWHEVTADGFESWGFWKICSECNSQVKYLEQKNYCPNCGADMKGGADMSREE